MLGVISLARVVRRFLSNLRALGKRASRDKERQSREEPEREATLPLVFAASPLFAFVFNLLKPLSYVGYYSLKFENSPVLNTSFNIYDCSPWNRYRVSIVSINLP